MAVRVNQSVVEFVTLGAPNVRVNQSVVEFVTLGIPPTIACDNPPQGTVFVPYTHTFPAAGGVPPFVFSITAGALPPGLTLNPATGVVSGIPSEPGIFGFTISVVDANLNGSSVACSITILGVVRITLRGVKRTYGCREEVSATEVPDLPSVKRAM